MGTGTSEREQGYIAAKLEDIDRRLTTLAETQTFAHTKLSAEVAALKDQVQDYTSQWKGVRWLGAAALAIIIAVKTGSLSPLKALFAAAG